jgi:hypothetical protein
MNKAAHSFRLALVALILAVMPALAQDAAPGPAASSAWRVVLTPYLWLPGINAEVTSRTGRSIPQGGVSASASEGCHSCMACPSSAPWRSAMGGFRCWPISSP